MGLKEKAFNLVKILFKDHKDKAGAPYLLHLVRVSKNVKGDFNKTVALLHDTLEDTQYTHEQMTLDFGVKIADTVKILTKKESQTYTDYIKELSKNTTARKVKIADLEDNMNISRLDKVTPSDLDRLNKYIQAYKYLLQHE